LKGINEGLVMALRDIAQIAGINWESVSASLKQQGRLHLETY